MRDGHRTPRGALPVVLCNAACSCTSPKADCPPEATVGALHAAAYYFQHGPVENAHAQLQLVKAGLGVKPQGAIEAELMRQLTALDATPSAEPDALMRGAERVRVILSEWRCLPDELHHRLHQQLGSPP